MRKTVKYVISDKDEVVLGYDFHQNLARDFKGRVISAGHCKSVDGKFEVYGESIGYGIQSKPEDAEYLNKHEGVLKNVELKHGY